MNIAPINIFTDNTKKTPIADYKSAKLISHIKEPICDTVSFGTANRASKLTKTVYQLIENSEFTNAYNQLKTKGFSSFNPNYYKTSADNKKVSMIGLLIDKFDEKMSPAKMLGYVSLFCTICRLSDFLLDNENAEGDLFLKAIEKPLPPLMIETMYYSEAIGDIAPWEKYPIYSKAIEKATESMSEEGSIERFLTISQNMDAEYADYQEAGMQYGAEATKNGESKTVYSDAADADEGEDISLDKLKVTLGPHDPKSLDDVGGYPDMIEEIRRRYIKPWHPDYRERYDNHPNIKRPTGLLLSGPPGCGKTYLAHAIAAELGYDFYHVSLSNVGSKWAYVTAKNIPRVFDQLEEVYKKTGKPNVVLLDEIDSIASHRDSNAADYKNDDVNALITSINNAAQRGIILIGATNFLDNVDSAAHRSGRFDLEFKMDYPDKDGRKMIIEKILSKDEISAGLVKYSEAFADATEDLSPADIASAIGLMWNDVLLSDDKKVAQPDDFYEALKITKRKIEDGKPKPIGFNNSKSAISEKGLDINPTDPEDTEDPHHTSATTGFLLNPLGLATFVGIGHGHPAGPY